jgi:hypothetical protein
VLTTLFGVAIIGAAPEIGVGNPWAIYLFILIGLFATFFSVCGYLGARDAARSDVHAPDAQQE